MTGGGMEWVTVRLVESQKMKLRTNMNAPETRRPRIKWRRTRVKSVALRRANQRQRITPSPRERRVDAETRVANSRRATGIREPVTGKSGKMSRLLCELSSAV